jgi:hypothetical protein
VSGATSSSVGGGSAWYCSEPSAYSYQTHSGTRVSIPTWVSLAAGLIDGRQLDEITAFVVDHAAIAIGARERAGLILVAALSTVEDLSLVFSPRRCWGREPCSDQDSAWHAA